MGRYGRDTARRQSVLAKRAGGLVRQVHFFQ
jgi:hypothetical protein